MIPNGTAIKDARQSRGVSQRKLAALAGVSASQLSRIESGKAGEAGGDLVTRIAGALDISVEKITCTSEKVQKLDITRQVPYPGSADGEVFHYTPAEAARFLPWSALQLRRKAYAREIPFNEGGRRITFTGRDIREISEMTAVRPLSETVQRRASA